MEIFFTDAVNSVPGQFFTALVNKQAVLIKRFGFDTILDNIAFDKLNGSLCELYSTITIAFTQDDQRIILRVKIIKVQCSDLTGPGAGVLKQMKDGIIAEAVLFDEIDAMKNLQDFVWIEKTDQLFLGTFLGNIQYPLSLFPIFGIHQPDHFGQGFYGGQAVVAGSDHITAMRFEVIEKSQDHIGGKMFDPERGNFYGKFLGRKG